MKSLRSRVGPGTLFAIAIVVLFIAIWGNVLIGHTYLIGADDLYGYAPWSASPEVHSGQNWLVADAVREFVPWLGLTQQALRSGHLPLWDPYAMSGKPLLADYQSAAFSPFTLAAVALQGPYGFSISMLLKLWVAGLGMFVYLRVLGARPIAAGFGALAYATSSYIVVWMAWPQSSVAALAPWSFAAVEWYLRRASPLAFAGVAGSIALVLFAGHPETSITFAEGIVLYSAARFLLPTGWGGGPKGRWGHGLGTLAGLSAAALLGCAVAAVQLLPFAQEALRTSLGTYHQGVGIDHLHLSALSSWLIPNLEGNPGIDGLLGRPPHYNASTGFAGIAALVVAAVGVFRSQALMSVRIGLALMALWALGLAYGPLTAVVGRLPFFSAIFTNYQIMLICFAVAAFAGLGMEALLARPPQVSRAAKLGLLLGGAAIVATALLTLAFVVFRVRAESYFGHFPVLLHSGFVFWTLLGAATLIAAAALVFAAWFGRSTLALTGIFALALMEGGMFAGPYQPQVPRSEVYPRSPVMSWLQANAGDQRVAGIGTALIPETSSYYRLSDVRGYDVVRPPGMKAYWSLADPNYYDDGLYATLNNPDPDWLAAAGVKYVVTSSDKPVPGTEVAYTAQNVGVEVITNARPLVFAAPQVTCVANQDAAISFLKTNGPLSSVVLQSNGCPATSSATVTASSPRPEVINVQVDASSPTVVVLLQSFTPDWVATVDGQPSRVLQADLQFQAVSVPAGHHLLTLTYSPTSVRIGLLVSLIALVAILALIVLGVWPSLRRGNRIPA